MIIIILNFIPQITTREHHISADRNEALTRKADTEGFKSPNDDDVKTSPVDGSLSINDRFALPLPYGTADLAPELVEIVAAWPQLPEAIKAEILAMVKVSSK
jgi:hypothetical protein